VYLVALYNQRWVNFGYGHLQACAQIILPVHYILLLIGRSANVSNNQMVVFSNRTADARVANRRLFCLVDTGHDPATCHLSSLSRGNGLPTGLGDPDDVWNILRGISALDLAVCQALVSNATAVREYR
jgi:hypothetical protein